MAGDSSDFDRSLGSIRNLFITELAKLHRDKKTLRSPFHKLPSSMSFASWKDDALPLYSWPPSSFETTLRVSSG
jgi:hypothetical protein